MKRYLISTQSHKEYPFSQLEEFTVSGESLEVRIERTVQPVIREGKTLYERYQDFFAFRDLGQYALGEGNTPLLDAGKLTAYTGIDGLLLKNETQNPTWSFKDRGSVTCIAMAKKMKESITATISTGNMGNSIAAYGARAGLKVLVFLPSFAPEEKLLGMVIHGAHIVRIDAPDYSAMKTTVLNMAKEHNLRIVSGNGPIRTEGYKSEAFEIYEQLGLDVPEYIAIPTSACGHIRGVFKGFKELLEAGYIKRLPKMVVVQAQNNSPIVSAIKSGKDRIIPFSNFHTIAEAITSGTPQGGDEIVQKANQYGWLAEDVTEEEIIESQRLLAGEGLFVEPASATSLAAVKKLHASGLIKSSDRVVLILTGSGLKDSGACSLDQSLIHNPQLQNLQKSLNIVLDQLNK